MSPPARHRAPVLLIAIGFAGVLMAGVGLVVLLLLLSAISPDGECSTPAAGIVLGPPGSGQEVGASEYGGPGDPASGTVGASGASLLAHPDSYAELGGYSFQTATLMGGLPYMTPLRITWGSRSATAYKRDFGLGGGPIDGFPRVIDLWWQLAGALGIPYEAGQWSGPVRIERPPTTGAGGVLAQTPGQPDTLTTATVGSACAPGTVAGVALTPGERARLEPDGLAAAPASAPLAVKEIIAAGNQIVGRPYVYGGGHGVPLDEVAPAYDCSSSVEHLLYGARLLPAGYAAASSALESFGAAGAGRWVTVYASADHVFMYVAGLRWDTWNAAGPGDGSSGIGWHPLIRSSAGFVPRHPVGL